MMYFIHDRFNANSLEILATLPSDITVVDYFADSRFQRLKGIKEVPCYLEKLEFEDTEGAQTEKKLNTMAFKIEKLESQLRAIQAQQQEQQSLIVECFTDLDTMLNGGGNDADTGLLE